MRVLVAEDDQASGKFLCKLLSRYGEVELTTDGIQAVDTFVAAASEKNFFDLVCLDIMMPKIDDASYASEDYDDYICKPIDVMKFDSIIKKLGVVE